MRQSNVEAKTVPNSRLQSSDSDELVLGNLRRNEELDERFLGEHLSEFVIERGGKRRKVSSGVETRRQMQTHSVNCEGRSKVDSLLSHKFSGGFVLKE